jgi:outer membrane immunogenic protein
LILLSVTGMKQLIRLMGVLFVGSALTAAFAGTEIYSGKESKVVAPAPAPTLCDWTGFYVGLHAGGQFGHSETTDLDDWNFPDRQFGYSESDFNGGAQFGYNFQWHWLVTGPEFDVGYMNLHGRGAEPGTTDSFAETDSDFYTTLRGRVGVALDCWLIYATGGGIGVNYTTRFKDTGADNGNVLDARTNDFDWGWTVGGGVERMINRHWSIKAEYLYYKLDDQHFSGVFGGTRFGFNAETEGNIIRAGLNYKF